MNTGKEKDLKDQTANTTRQETGRTPGAADRQPGTTRPEETEEEREPETDRPEDDDEVKNTPGSTKDRTQ